jgi:hypothetical protein
MYYKTQQCNADEDATLWLQLYVDVKPGCEIYIQIGHLQMCIRTNITRQYVQDHRWST